MPFGYKGGRELRVFARLGAVGLELGISTIIGLFAGRWVDGLLGSEPLVAILGLMLGSVAGFRSLVRTARESMNDLAKSENDPQSNTTHVTAERDSSAREKAASRAVASKSAAPEPGRGPVQGGQSGDPSEQAKNPADPNSQV